MKKTIRLKAIIGEGVKNTLRGGVPFFWGGTQYFHHFWGGGVKEMCFVWGGGIPSSLCGGTLFKKYIYLGSLNYPKKGGGRHQIEKKLRAARAVQLVFYHFLINSYNFVSFPVYTSR